VLLLPLASLVAGCGGDGIDDEPNARPQGSITVFAASSLTDAFTTLAERFETRYSGASIDFNFAASSELAAQIDNGAPGDVFASADESNMVKLTNARLNVGEPIAFARNKLAIAVERGNPAGVDALADLARDDLTVVLCASEVPCGALADAALTEAGVAVSPASREPNVRATLTKVALGEADAAVVYATDVHGNDGVGQVPIPDEHNVTTALGIVVLEESGNRRLAAEWIEFLTSRAAQRVLQDEYGFLAP
jgi:molybdate transport system substrate-binding protein